MSAQKKYDRLGEQVFSKVDKVNAELFTLTYGSIVMQLIKDYEDVNEVNVQLEKMGYNIGLRLIEEFLARSHVGRCADFVETAEVIAKVGMKMFLNITGTVTDWDSEKKEFSLILEENPLVEFVELPEQYNKLWYSNILCGVLRGALEMVQMKVETKFVRCVLRGDDSSEIRVILKEILADEMPPGDD
eukprot:TRINITY_DN17858_c0_g1_i1.p2 TRINITY_DN17858_c0_g1~~TRINITY_DN17858_c0_g1_i1.p2  ORF type:complete len:188 (-),score=43.37 TRINITY_DN17858_c0_g1_i1:744-1307(-)